MATHAAGGAGGWLSTHVLDTATGRPAAGLALSLWRLEGGARTLVREAVTNTDGRCDAPLLQGAEFRPGLYELVFAAGAYLRTSGAPLTEPPFLDEIPIRFGLSDPAAHYHVPLLLSPYSYSTYRGS